MVIQSLLGALITKRCQENLRLALRPSKGGFKPLERCRRPDTESGSGLTPLFPSQTGKQLTANTIRRIFENVNPESLTIGTLRFEEGFHKMRNTFFQSPELVRFVEGMVPMFSPKLFPGTKKPKSGKFSFSEEKRAEIFSFVIAEIKKHSDCPIALCKESATVWEKVGLPLSECGCACQLVPVDMTNKFMINS